MARFLAIVLALLFLSKQCAHANDDRDATDVVNEMFANLCESPDTISIPYIWKTHDEDTPLSQTTYRINDRCQYQRNSKVGLSFGVDRSGLASLSTGVMLIHLQLPGNTLSHYWHNNPGETQRLWWEGSDGTSGFVDIRLIDADNGLRHYSEDFRLPDNEVGSSTRYFTADTVIDDKNIIISRSVGIGTPNAITLQPLLY